MSDVIDSGRAIMIRTVTEAKPRLSARSKPLPLRAATTSRLTRRWISAELTARPAFPVLSDLGWLDAHCTTTAQATTLEPSFGPMLAEALGRLDPQSRSIVTARRLTDEPADLRSLAHHHQISPHRAAMIEQRAFAAVQDWMRAHIALRRAREAEHSA